MNLDDTHLDLETTLPVPGKDFTPSSDFAQVVAAAVRTVQALEKAGATFPDATPDEKDVARAAFRQVHAPTSAPSLTSGAITSGVSVHLRDLLSSYDQAVIQSAVQIRTYIVNRLLEETNHVDPKVRLKALELLGKAADVNLFTEATAGADPTKATSEDLEKRIRDKLRGLQGAVDVKFKEVDVMKDLGL